MARGVAAVGFALALSTLMGAGPPDIVRVQVPADQVSKWFPQGSELRGLPLAEFEALAKKAEAGLARRGGAPGPRLVRGRHAAKWVAGTLVGRSEFVFESPGNRPTPLVLEPWTPATVTAPDAGTPTVRSLADGRTALWVGPSGATALSVAWELRAQPGSDGRVFALGLPQLDIASLTLDLPGELVPEGPNGLRQGPAPGSTTARRSWRFDGPGGPIDLRLRSQGDASERIPGPRFWVGGPTLVEIDEASARWRADWSVETGDLASGSPRLVVQLDPSLELVEVTGPDVVAFQAEREDSGTLLSIRLADDLEAATVITVQGLAKVPDEGRWAVPSARPKNAYWTGGRTVVKLGPGRVLAACQERAGLRVAPRADEAIVPPPLVFEASAPRSVADLVLEKPAAEASCKVRGQLRLGSHVPRVDVQLVWRVQRGRRLALDIDLPPGWTADRLQIAGSDETTSWQSEPGPRPGDGSRLRVVLPTSLDQTSAFTVNVAATHTVASLVGPIDLPRVRPVDARMADEIWVAQVETGWTIRPLQAKGLAWIDPMLVLNESAGPFASFLGQRGGLAWRWITEGAAAQVDRVRDLGKPRGEIKTLASVGSDRLAFDLLVALELPPGDSHSVDIGSSEPFDPAPAWRLAGSESGPPLASRTLSSAERLALGLPAEGSAWSIDLPHTRAARVVLRAHVERPWKGQGRLPLLMLPTSVPAEGKVLVLVNRASRSNAEAKGLHVLDLSVTWNLFLTGSPGLIDRESGGPSLASHRRAHAFGYEQAPASLGLATETLQQGPVEGVIQEAVLSTTAALGNSKRQRLTLQVAPTRARSLQVTLPQGSRLERIRRDGQTVVVNQLGESLAVPLAASQSGHTIQTISLEYTTHVGPAPDNDLLRPQALQFSLPCLAMSWELDLPEDWRVAERGSTLMSADVPGKPDFDLTRVRWPWLNRGSRDGLSATEAAMLRDLDSRVAVNRARALTLGDLFMRWDAGRWALIIDREALAEAGWGPSSRVSSSSSEPDRPSVAAALDPLGLTVVPIGGVLLVTTLAESPRAAHRASAGEALGRMLGEAASSGSDTADRFQSVSRWRGEPTPVLPLVRQPGDDAGWMRHRVSAIGRLGESGWIRVDNPRQGAAWAAALALAILLAGVAARKAAARWRGAVLAMVVAVALITAAWTLPNLATIASGGALGAVAVLAFWWGRSQRSNRSGRAGRADRATTSSPSRRSGTGSGLAIGGAILVAVVAVGAGLAAGADEPIRRILALIPFEGAPDPQVRDGRVLLLLKDFEQLGAWAEPAPEPAGAGLSAARALHRVRGMCERAIQVETELELWAEGHESRAWSVPLGDAHDLVATLDGERVLLQVQPGAATATVDVAGEGKHVLKLSRTVVPVQSESGAMIRVPINVVAAARAVVEAPTDERRVELLRARGRVVARGSVIEGEVGPVGEIEVRWGARSKLAAAPAKGTVEGAILWDTGPAGDRVRAHLSYRNPSGTSLVRLALEPGLVVRSASVPGLIEASMEGRPDRPEWVAHVEPPLPDGASLDLDLWRSSPAAAPGQGVEPVGPPGPDIEGQVPANAIADHPVAHRLPRIEPLGVERYSGLVAFRRPDEWAGRLLAPVGAASMAESITADAFAKAWGALPADHLVWAGACRFARVPTIEVTTGPALLRRAVRQTVQVKVEPGRLDVQVDAELTDRVGRSFDVELSIHRDWHLVRAEGEGLVSWSRPAPDRLRLQFDGKDTARRLVRLEGWLPIVSDPLATANLRRQAAVPWPRWVRAAEERGTLVITASTSPLVGRAGAAFTPRLTGLDTGSGVVAIAPSEAGISAPAVPSNRLAFRVDRPDDLGLLHWTAEPPRVNVTVQSLLTVHPDTTAWEARVGYQVSGGASDALYFKLPAAWAASARVEIKGLGHELTARTEGSTTFWTIRPERPIWGALEVTIHASRPLTRGEPFAFPDLVPLGWGTADTYMAVANASGLALEYEGSPGLQPIDASRLPPEGLPLTAGVPTNVYRVRRDDWTLRIRAPGESRQANANDDPTRVTLADLTCVVGADGTVIGQARFDLEPHAGPFLAVLLPPGAEALRATVDALPAQPLRGSADHWLIPLGDAGAASVTLVWRSEAAAAGATGLLASPALEQEKVRTLLTVYAPEEATLSEPGGLLEPVSGATVEVERTDRIGRSILASLDQIDRSSARDRQEVIANLTRFELQARAAERAARSGLADRSVAAEQSYRRAVDRVAAARTTLLDALRGAGLDAWSQAAQANVGLATLPARNEPAAVPIDPAGGIRLRRLGRGHYYRGDALGRGRAPELRWVVPPPVRPWQRADVWLITLLGLAAAVGVQRVVERGERPWLLGAVSIGLAVGVGALGVASPLALGLVLGTVLLGRFAGA
ncbi:MAG TPA: hypothetical protein VGZ22_01730 [Isosphaeraceae bacterium]|jgi:hypothetical protein|nr:hypothetical protein [Isosphaeraceae bacterium]